MLSSFFDTQNSLIAADKTTVTINPKNQQDDIIQKDLFAIIRSDADIELAKEQWAGIFVRANDDDKGTAWVQALDDFETKTLDFLASNDQIQPQVTLTYNDETALRALGVWYDA